MKVLYKLSSLSEGSVTRRSAGLPLIINTILASEARIKQVSYVFVSAFIVHTLILISCFLVVAVAWNYVYVMFAICGLILCSYFSFNFVRLCGFINCADLKFCVGCIT